MIKIIFEKIKNQRIDTAIQGKQVARCIMMLLVGLMFFFGQESLAQTLPDTDDTQRRFNSPPQPGWSNVGGSCDCSDKDEDGIQDVPWFGNAVYPAPIAGHTHFMSCGSWFSGGESAQATITGLTVGEQYIFTFYVAGFKNSANNLIYKEGDNYQVVIGNESSGTVSFTNPNTWTLKTFTFTADFVSETITLYGSDDPGFSIVTADQRYTHFSFGSNAVAPVCAGGANSPNLSATTLNNVCPVATTADLTSITASNMPAGTTLTWHTATPATTANKIANPSSVVAGTYYAAFYDAANDCYSGTNGDATTSVTVAIVACCAAGEEAPQF